jgi:RimJ/RimL family protein N-acetyltransferase
MLPEITLKTDRLTLRTPIEADFAAVRQFNRSPRTQFIGGIVEDEFQAWRGFLTVMGHWALRGYGFFTVLHGETPVGRVGLVNHIVWDEPEIGWHLFDGFEGKGYCTEAARAVLEWAHVEKGLGPLISYIHPDNAPSRRVAQRLGAVHERDGELLGIRVQVWRHKAFGAEAAA